MINPLPINGFNGIKSFYTEKRFFHCMMKILAISLYHNDTMYRFLAFYGEYRACRIHDLSYQEHFSDADNIHHPSISLYVVSRTIQNPSFNTPYDVTTRIKSLICKITRFYMKIFVTRSYGTLKRYIHDFLCCVTPV